MSDFLPRLTEDLIGNGTLILALCFVYRLLVQRLPAAGPLRGSAMGLLFGSAAILSMLNAVTYQPGVIFDGRTVMLSLGALHGGPLAAGIAGLFAAGYRLSLGGPGTLIGILVIASACLAGLAARVFFKRTEEDRRGWRLLALGLAVHGIAVALFLLLPLQDRPRILFDLAPAYLGVLTLGTWILGLLLADIDRYQHFEQLLRQSRDRFRFLFQSTATAMLDEDLSEVYRGVEQLRAEGVSDLRSHLRDNPETLSALIQRVQVRAVNPAAIALFGEHSERDLMQGIDRHFAPDSAQTFLEGLCAYWEGRDWLRQETRMARRDGSLFQALLAMPIASRPEDARHIPVNIIDVTPLRQREQELREQQSYLEGVLWGTDAGTWEWHIPSNGLRLNPRWGSLLGYDCDHPPPATFEERRQLLHPDDRARSDRLLARLLAGENSAYDCELRYARAGGGWQWMLERGKVTSREASGRPVRISGTLMDIDTRRRAVDRATRLAAVREALLYCHGELLRAGSRQAILERTVQALVRTRGYRLAWLGRVRVSAPGALPDIEVLARAGEAIDFTDTLGELFALSGRQPAMAQGQGQPPAPLSPSQLAALSGDIQVVDDLVDDTRDTPWKARAAECELRSAMIIPMPLETETLVLSLYSNLPGVFVDEERRLLEDFSRSLLIALQNL